MASPVDQNAPHRLGSDSEKMLAVAESIEVSQTEIGFLHQGGGIERLAGVVAGQLPRRQLAQLIINQRQQSGWRTGPGWLAGAGLRRSGQRWGLAHTKESSYDRRTTQTLRRALGYLCAAVGFRPACNSRR